MDIFNLLTMIGGLSLFLYGMNAMGAGLSKMAGGKLEYILEKLTSKRIYAVLLGAGVTAVIQSSSASTVMVVGFVNSGIMQLEQAVGIIMGANVGTTITSWMLSLTGIEGSTMWLKFMKPSSFSPVLAAIGIVMILGTQEGSRKKDIGNILLGFSILMFGMETMSGAVAPLASNEKFAGFFTAFSNPVLGMAAGAILTAIIQSSSASVGILQALCSTGVVSFGAALPIIMGQNIGTCVTSIISAVGANKNAKRAAMIHLCFNLIGTIVFMLVFYAINSIVPFAFLAKAATPAGIATIHSLFNIGACILLYPFADLLVKLASVLVKGSEEDEPVSKDQHADIALDIRFLSNPAFAMELCRNLTDKMAEETRNGLLAAFGCLQEYDKKKVKEVYALEERSDRYEDVLGTYLVKLSGKNLSKKDSQSMSVILHSISDFERIADHAVNLVESAKEMHKKKLDFSQSAREELMVLMAAVEEIANQTVVVFCQDDVEGARNIEPLEEVIDVLTKEIKKNHIKRLRKGKCTMELGLILEDILTNMERISDHCSNIAVELITTDGDSYDTHEYFENMSEKDKKIFHEQYNGFKMKYHLAGGKKQR